MSGIGNDVQIDLIIERILVAMEERAKLRDGAATDVPSRTVLTALPSLWPVLVSIAIVIGGGAVLRSDVATAKSQSETNRDAIGELRTTLRGIETNVDWLVKQEERQQQEREK